MKCATICLIRSFIVFLMLFSRPRITSTLHTLQMTLLNLQVRGLESGVVVPLTSMAAHAVDEEVDIELEVNNKVNETRENTKEAASGSLPFLPPPPPPIRETNHSRVSKFSEFHNFS